MKDFASWCSSKGLVNISNDGSVHWAENFCVGKKANYKDKLSGKVRKATDDLSKDYKGFSARNGTVWPFKVLGKK